VCLCDTDDCPAPNNPASTGVVVYVIAHHDTITGPDAPTPEAAASDVEHAEQATGDTITEPTPAETSDECTGLDGRAALTAERIVDDLELHGQPRDAHPDG
jgi:hypothetical protein